MTREQLIDIAVDNWPDTVIDLLINVLEAPTEEQQKCEYCHDITLEECHKLLEENTTEDSRYIVKVKYCEVCGRKLGDN